MQSLQRNLPNIKETIEVVAQGRYFQERDTEGETPSKGSYIPSYRLDSLNVAHGVYGSSLVVTGLAPWTGKSEGIVRLVLLRSNMELSSSKGLPVVTMYLRDFDRNFFRSSTIVGTKYQSAGKSWKAWAAPKSDTTLPCHITWWNLDTILSLVHIFSIMYWGCKYGAGMVHCQVDGENGAECRFSWWHAFLQDLVCNTQSSKDNVPYKKNRASWIFNRCFKTRKSTNWTLWGVQRRPLTGPLSTSPK